MKNICFCFQMHAPYRLKRYRFFEIGHDHYYYDDMATEEHINWLVQTSYLPLCQTIRDMINLQGQVPLRPERERHDDRVVRAVQSRDD